MDKLEVTLVDHKDSNGVSFGQWYLVVNGNHVGYVQQASGGIQYILHMSQELADQISQEVKKQVGFPEVTSSMVPKLQEEYFTEEGEEDEDSGDDFS